ncbi:HGH1 protein, partial [Certhia familiaris]|nr:HGH1 protein [Certhia familiaris]
EQLMATKCGRLQVRSRGSYLVLRELHTWEKNPEVLRTCEKVIQVVIGDEPEEGLENLLEVTIPEEVERQLRDRDRLEEEEGTTRGQRDVTCRSPGGHEDVT